MPRLQLTSILSDDRLERSVSYHVLFVSSDVLSQFRLFSGACVSVNAKGVQIFCEVRPCTSTHFVCPAVHLSRCAARAMECQVGCMLDISPPILVSGLKFANVITLQLIAPLFNLTLSRLPNLALLGNIVCKNCFITIECFNQPSVFRIVRANGESAHQDKDAFVVGPDSRIEFSTPILNRMSNERSKWMRAVCSEISGYSQLVRELVEGMSHCLNLPVSFSNSGYLLYGVPGCGKTCLALSLARHSDLPFFIVQGPQLFGVEQGSAEKTLSSVFQNALTHSPAIIVIDDIDVMCSGQSLIETRVLAHFRTLIDDLRKESDRCIFIIATTSRFQAIDPALQGFCLRPIEMRAPTAAGRLDILRQLCHKLSWASVETQNVQPILSFDDVLSQIGQRTQGFVGGDLQALCLDALMNASKRSGLTNRLTEADFDCLKKRVPANLAALSFRPKSSNMSFAQLAGLDCVIAKLRRLLIDPYVNILTYSKQQERLGTSLPSGVLLHGPPGVGKTSLALAVANECNMNVLMVNGAQLVTKHVGDSEKAITSLFSHARQSAPCLIVVDQFEVFAPRRLGGGGPADRMLSCLLMELNGIADKHESLEQRVMIIATTSHPHLLDPAVMRPGRLDEQLDIPLPDKAARASIVTMLLSRMNTVGQGDIGSLVRELASATPGYSGADLTNLAREAGLLALREDLKSPVTKEHFSQALQLKSDSFINPDVVCSPKELGIVTTE